MHLLLEKELIAGEKTFRRQHRSRTLAGGAACSNQGFAEARSGLDDGRRERRDGRKLIPQSLREVLTFSFCPLVLAIIIVFVLKVFHRVVCSNKILQVDNFSYNSYSHVINIILNIRTALLYTLFFHVRPIHYPLTNLNLIRIGLFKKQI